MRNTGKNGNRKPIPEKLRIGEPLNTEFTKKQVQIAKTWITSHIRDDWLATYKALKTAQIAALEKGKKLDVLCIEGCRTFCLELHLKNDEVTALQQMKGMALFRSIEEYQEDLRECQKWFQESDSMYVLELFRKLFVSLDIYQTD